MVMKIQIFIIKNNYTCLTKILINFVFKKEQNCFLQGFS